MRKVTLFLILSTILLSTEIGEIVYRGKSIAPFMLLKEGEEFSRWKVYLSVQRAYSTGEFANIYVKKENADGKVKIIIEGRAKQRIKRIEFYSSEKFSSFPGFLFVRRGQFFSEEDAKKEGVRITNWLKARGYLKSKVKYNFEKGFLRFNINLGKRFRISKLTLDGKEIGKVGDLKVGAYYLNSAEERTKEFLINKLKKQGYLRGQVIIKKKVLMDSIEIHIRQSKGKKFSIKIKGYYIPEEILYPYWEKDYSRSWALYEGKTTIREYLLDKGLYVKSIKGEVSEFEDLIEIIYKLEGVKKLKKRKILFEGNTFFSDRQLRSLIPASKVVFSKFKLQDIRDGIVYIREKYLEAGFTDVVITWEPHEEGVLIKIKEGLRYIISGISFTGNKSIRGEEIIKRLGVEEGSPYYSLSLYAATQNIKNLYLDRGFRKTEVYYQTEIMGTKVKVHFYIKEGIRPVLSLIYISGVVGKRGRAIIKEYLPLKLGKPVNMSILEEGRIKLESIGIFTLVEVRENIWDKDHTDLIIRAEQLPFSTYSFGVGWEERGGPRITFDLSMRNRPVSPIILNAGVQIGGSEKIVGVTSELPHMFYSWDLRSSATYEKGNMVSYSYEMANIIFSLSRMEENFWNQISIRWSRIELFDLQIPPSEVDREFLPVYLTSISYIYTVDKRDDPINPQHGWFFSASTEKYFAIFGTKVDALKTYLHFQSFRNMGKTTIALGMKLGLAKGNLPIRERFFAGGSMSFRGTETDMLSPLNASNNMPIGGKGLAILNLEYRVKLYGMLEFVTFYDGGEVTYLMKDLRLKNWQSAFGMGFRYSTPFGPIRLEVGYNPNPKYGNKVLFFIALGELL